MRLWWIYSCGTCLLCHKCLIAWVYTRKMHTTKKKIKCHIITHVKCVLTQFKLSCTIIWYALNRNNLCMHELSRRPCFCWRSRWSYFSHLAIFLNLSFNNCLVKDSLLIVSQVWWVNICRTRELLNLQLPLCKHNHMPSTKPI